MLFYFLFSFEISYCLPIALLFSLVFVNKIFMEKKNVKKVTQSPGWWLQCHLKVLLFCIALTHQKLAGNTLKIRWYHKELGKILAMFHNTISSYKLQPVACIKTNTSLTEVWYGVTSMLAYFYKIIPWPLIILTI